MKTRRIISAVLLCLYIAAVAFLCFSKPEDMPQIAELWFGLPSDKVAHFLMFCPYPLLSYLVFASEDRNIWKKVALMGIIMVSGLGIAIGTEQIQVQLTYRSAELKDFYADAAGLAFGMVCTIVYMFFEK